MQSDSVELTPIEEARLRLWKYLLIYTIRDALNVVKKNTDYFWDPWKHKYTPRPTDEEILKTAEIGLRAWLYDCYFVNGIKALGYDPWVVQQKIERILAGEGVQNIEVLLKDHLTERSNYAIHRGSQPRTKAELDAQRDYEAEERAKSQETGKRKATGSR